MLAMDVVGIGGGRMLVMDTTAVVDISGVMVMTADGEGEAKGVDVADTGVGVGLGDGVINGISLPLGQLSVLKPLVRRKNSTVIAPLAFMLEPPQNTLKSLLPDIREHTLSSVKKTALLFCSTSKLSIKLSTDQQLQPPPP